MRPCLLPIGLAALLAAAPAGAQTLQEALAQAYNNNPTLLAARAQLRAVDENVPQALAGWRPTVLVTGSYGHTDLTTRGQRLANGTFPQISQGTARQSSQESIW